MGANLEIYKTKKTKLNNKILKINDDSYKQLGDIDCSYHSMDSMCKSENIVEATNREKWDDFIYHTTDDKDIENIEDWIGTKLDYDKENEIIIVIYDNA